jgi:hypothetical protein
MIWNAEVASLYKYIDISSITKYQHLITTNAPLFYPIPPPILYLFSSTRGGGGGVGICPAYRPLNCYIYWIPLPRPHSQLHSPDFHTTVKMRFISLLGTPEDQYTLSSDWSKDRSCYFQRMNISSNVVYWHCHNVLLPFRFIHFWFCCVDVTILTVHLCLS